MPKFLVQLRRDLGRAQVGARARARLLRVLRLRRQVARRDRPVPRSTRHASRTGRGRSTSRSCTRCWRIYLQLYGLCAGNGIDPGNIAKMLQGRDSQDHGDRPGDVGSRRRGQAPRHRRPVRARATIRSATRSPKAGGNASIWLTKFDDFLKIHGWRTEGIADINIPSWIENQASPLGQLRNFVQMEERHDFDKSLVDSHRERDEAIDAGAVTTERRQPRRVQPTARHLHRRQLRVVERRPQLLHRPALRRSRCAGVRWPRPRPSAPTPTTTPRSCSGRSCKRCAAATSPGRTSSRSRRPVTSTTTTTRTCAETIPKVVGTLPDKVEDPVLIEIFGMHSHYFAGLKADPHTTDAQRLPGVGRHLHGPGAGDGLGDGAVRSRGGRDPRHRGDVTELDAGVRDHRRLRVRRRRIADARRDGQSASTASPAWSARRLPRCASRPAISSRSTAPGSRHDPGARRERLSHYPMSVQGQADRRHRRRSWHRRRGSSASSASAGPMSSRPTSCPAATSSATSVTNRM